MLSQKISRNLDFLKKIFRFCTCPIENIPDNQAINALTILGMSSHRTFSIENLPNVKPNDFYRKSCKSQVFIETLIFYRKSCAFSSFLQIILSIFNSPTENHANIISFYRKSCRL